MGRGRPVKTNADFVAEVMELVGSEYTFLETYKTARKKIKVVHNECGHEYLVTPDSFISGRRCPMCNTGPTLKTDAEFRDEVKSLVGDEYLFLGGYTGAHKKVRFLHVGCGHKYLATPSSFLRGKRCPRCSESKGEKAISSFLHTLGIPFTAEYQIRYENKKHPLRIDFIVDGVAIEYDGRQHFEAIESWGGERGLRETQHRDRIKNEYCEKHGIPMIRIPYWDFDRIDEILTDKLLPIIRKKDDKLA